MSYLFLLLCFNVLITFFSLYTSFNIFYFVFSFVFLQTKSFLLHFLPKTFKFLLSDFDSNTACIKKRWSAEDIILLYFCFLWWYPKFKQRYWYKLAPICYKPQLVCTIIGIFIDIYSFVGKPWVKKKKNAIYLDL